MSSGRPRRERQGGRAFLGGDAGCGRFDHRRPQGVDRHGRDRDRRPAPVVAEADEALEAIKGRHDVPRGDALNGKASALSAKSSGRNATGWRDVLCPRGSRSTYRRTASTACRRTRVSGDKLPPEGISTQPLASTVRKAPSSGQRRRMACLGKNFGARTASPPCSV